MFSNTGHQLFMTYENESQKLHLQHLLLIVLPLQFATVPMKTASLIY